jgi:hypothetical protein
MAYHLNTCSVLERRVPQPRFRYDDPLGHHLWDPRLLIRLFAKHGLATATADIEDAWRRLASAPDTMPVALLDALYHVRELASYNAHEELIDGFGGPLFASDCRALPPRDVALLAWLDHPDLFNRVRGRRVISSVRRFREFKGRQALPIDLPNADTLRRLERRLGLGFERRNRSVHCRIHAYTLDDVHHFDIRHGRPRVRDSSLDELANQIRETHVEYRPQQVDRVSYLPDTGVLRVTARDARTMRTYCEAFGELLCGQLGWFSNTAVLTLTPLVADAVDAPRPTSGILDVQLVRAVVACAGQPGMDLTFQCKDVFAGIAQHGGVNLTDGELVSAHLSVTYAHGGTRLTRLMLPNHVAYNNHRDEPIIRHFLEERGFLDGPMRFRMAC